MPYPRSPHANVLARLQSRGFRVNPNYSLQREKEEAYTTLLNAIEHNVEGVVRHLGQIFALPKIVWNPLLALAPVELILYASRNVMDSNILLHQCFRWVSKDWKSSCITLH